MFESAIAANRANWTLRIVLAFALLALVAVAISFLRMVVMPLTSYKGQLPALTAGQSDLANRLSEHVKYLTTTVRERTVEREGSMQSSLDYLRRNLVQAGYTVAEQPYTMNGGSVSNLEAQVKGTSASDGAIVVGAHYDAVEGTVGADDNASGVAATLELARLMAQARPRRTIRFVFFANEEPPYFQTDRMGSLVYAKKLRSEGIQVRAMISLEMLGFYSDASGSQKYPAPFSLFYPSRGNFIAFVSNSESRGLVRRAIRKFRESASFPSEGVTAPENLPGVGWSDHWSFWQEGYPAIMITDTALFRNPHYHTQFDTVDKLDFEKMARVVEGIQKTVVSIADEP